MVDSACREYHIMQTSRVVQPTFASFPITYLHFHLSLIASTHEACECILTLQLFALALYIPTYKVS